MGRPGVVSEQDGFEGRRDRCEQDAVTSVYDEHQEAWQGEVRSTTWTYM